MRDKMGLSKVELFPRSHMRWISVRHIPVFKRRVQGGMDGYGRRFKIYTNKYMKLKSNRFKSEKTGKRYKYPKGSISSTQVYPPNLTLTGLMMRNLSRKKYSKRGYTLGFTGESAEKAIGNKAHGRNIIDRIPTKEKKFLVKLMNIGVKKQTAKLKNVTINIPK